MNRSKEAPSLDPASEAAFVAAYPLHHHIQKVATVTDYPTALRLAFYEGRQSVLNDLEATEKRYQALLEAATSYAEATAVIIRSPDEMRQGPLNGQIDALNRLLAAPAALEENPDAT